MAMTSSTPLVRGATRPVWAGRPALFLSSAIASIAFGLLSPAAAQAVDECGPAEQGTVTCTPAGNPYPDGIDYTTPPIDPAQDPAVDPAVPVYDLTVNLEPGVAVQPANGSGVRLFGLNDGAVTLNAGESTDIAVSGAVAAGVFAGTDSGDLTINTDNIVGTGERNAGILALSDSGDIRIDADSIAVTAVGIYADTYGDVTIDVNDVSTQEDNASAIVAFGEGTSVTIQGAVSTAGESAHGVYTEGYSGGVSVVNNGTVTTTGPGSRGIFASSDGDVEVSGTGSVSSTGIGIDVHSDAGDITVEQGAIATSGDDSVGVQAVTDNLYGSAGNVTIDTGTVTTTGDGADGINVSATYGGAIAIRHDAITTAGAQSWGIDAAGRDDVSIVGESITTTGYNSFGVSVRSDYGVVSVINTGTISTVGDYSDGVVATSSSDVAIDADAITTQGYSSYGVYVEGEDASVSTGAVSTSGDDSVGVMVMAQYDAAATVRRSVTTSGDYADAVAVIANSGTASAINNGTILTTGAEANGIDARSRNGDVEVSGTGSVETRGDTSAAIRARADVGTVEVASGSVTTSGYDSDGIDAFGGNGVAIGVGSVTTTGGQSTGILAGGNASVLVNADAVRTSGAASDGIVALSFGGDVLMDVGSVQVSGADSLGIRAFGIGGGADVSVSGAVRAESGDGVRLLAGGVGGGGLGGLGDPALDGIARLTVGDGGSITSGTDAVAIVSVRGASVNNAGTIAGGSGYALSITGGPATIANSGTIAGRLLLTDGNDTLTNSGTLVLTGASDFGAGSDLLTNAGAIRLARAGTAQTASVAGLETLNSSGAIDLRNGVAGDRLSFAGTAYTGSGNASLGLDIAFANGVATADQLVLGSAAGSSAISLAVQGIPTLIAPITLVDVGSTSSGATFTLSPESRELGLVSFGLSYDSGGTAFQLVSAPSPVVYAQAQLGEALTTLWNRSADAVSARLGAGRDAAWATGGAASTGRVWFQLLGEANTRRDRRSFNFLGLAQDDVNLGYRQDAFGIQAGVDLIRGDPESGFTAGITAGYLNSTTRFTAGRGDRFVVDAGNIGLYAGFRGGPVFVTALAKYDAYKVDRRSYFVPLNGKDNAHAWGGRVEAGLRLGSARFFAEPLVSLAYSRTSLDDFTVGPNSFDYDRFTGLRGKAGLRIGGHTTLGGNATAFYVGGAAVREFKGKDGLIFTSGTQVLDLRARRLGTYGQATAGANITMSSGVSGFIEGHAEFGGPYRGGGGRAGLRIAF